MPRRGENIYKRNDGRWEGRVRKADGKYKYIYAKSYKEIKEKKKIFLENVINETDKLCNQKCCASEAFKNWLNSDDVKHLKSSTYESYFRCANLYIIPFFSALENDIITEISSKQFLNSVNDNDKLSQAYKRKIIAVFKVSLRGIITDSQFLEQLLKNIKTKKTNYMRQPIEVFSVNEQKLIEKEIINSNDIRTLGILLCFYTGIRLGELCALTWGDMNFDSGTMTIINSVARIKNFNDEKYKTKLIVSMPKSRSSIREIPLPCFLEENLINYKGDENEYIFTGTNKPLDPRTEQRIFKKILKNSGVKERKFHAIRHTFATRALENGIDIKTLSEILGHSSAIISLKVYAHSLMESKIEAIKKLDNLYKKNNDIYTIAVK